MAWLKKKVQGHLDSFRGEKKSSSNDRINIEVKVKGPDDDLHLSDLESSITSTQGDFKKLIQQQKQQEEAVEEPKEPKKLKTSRLSFRSHRRGRSDGSIIIKDKRKSGEASGYFKITNNLQRQVSTSSGSINNMEYKGSFQDMQREFTNESFMTEFDDDVGKSVEKTLEKWREYDTSLGKSFNDIQRTIDERSRLLINMVTEYANEMRSKMLVKYTEQHNQAEKAISTLEMSRKGSQFGINDSSTVLASLPSVPKISTVELTQQSSESLKESVAALFGSFQTIQTRISSTVSREIKVTQHVNGTNDSTDNAQIKIMDRPQYLGTISAKYSKDVRECGVTDMAFTKDKHVIVIDKHNKSVKLLDTEGKLIRIIGKNVLKEPSRVTVLPWNNHMLITDSSTQTITIFNIEGAVISSFAEDLSSPVGHCVLSEENQLVAVINFDTKLVSVYQLDSDGSYRKLRSFPTGLDCPAYITSTATGNLVISDWSANKFRIYGTDGKFMKQVSKNGAGQGEISKPQGVHGDCHGNLFLGEKGNRRIQIFTEDGESTFIMDKKTYDLGIPMMMETTSDGYLIIAEYQGTIKFFQYLDIPGKEELNIGQRPKGRAISVVSPEILQPEKESVF